MTNVECRIKIEEKCQTEYKTECTLVPTTRQEPRTELECSTDDYYRETCKSVQRYVAVKDTKEECTDVPVEVCKPLQKEVCDNVVTKKVEKVPRKECKTVQEKVCY